MGAWFADPRADASSKIIHVNSVKCQRRPMDVSWLIVFNGLKMGLVI